MLSRGAHSLGGFLGKSVDDCKNLMFFMWWRACIWTISFMQNFSVWNELMWSVGLYQSSHFWEQLIMKLFLDLTSWYIWFDYDSKITREVVSSLEIKWRDLFLCQFLSHFLGQLCKAMDSYVIHCVLRDSAATKMLPLFTYVIGLHS